MLQQTDLTMGSTAYRKPLATCGCPQLLLPISSLDQDHQRVCLDCSVIRAQVWCWMDSGLRPGVSFVLQPSDFGNFYLSSPCLHLAQLQTGVNNDIYYGMGIK